jgi:hypothetical protein
MKKIFLFNSLPKYPAFIFFTQHMSRNEHDKCCERLRVVVT